MLDAVFHRAEGGDPLAMVAVASHLHGEGDEGRSLSWCARAISEGYDDIEFLCFIGELLHEGRLLAKDPRGARVIYEGIQKRDELKGSYMLARLACVRESDNAFASARNYILNLKRSAACGHLISMTLLLSAERTAGTVGTASFLAQATRLWWRIVSLRGNHGNKMMWRYRDCFPKSPVLARWFGPDRRYSLSHERVPENPVEGILNSAKVI